MFLLNFPQMQKFAFGFKDLKYLRFLAHLKFWLQIYSKVL